MDDLVRHNDAGVVVRGGRPLRAPVIRCLSWIVVATAVALASQMGIAFGQEQDSEAAQQEALEEILITGKRREERLTFEPTSVSVVEGSFIRQHHIDDFQDLGNYVANVRFDIGGSGQATSTAGMFPNIRGFSTSPRIQSMESPVGLVIDGVAYSRLEYFETAFFDIDRVVVLRGPQGTLFGKNTSVGLLDVSTNPPTDTLTGYFDVEIGEIGRHRAEAAVGGPLSPGNVNFRIAALFDEGDGFMTNTTALTDSRAPDKPGSHEQSGVRAQLQFPDLAGGADLLISYEHFDVKGEGLSAELREASPNNRALFLQFDANTDFQPGNNITSIAGNFSRHVKLDNFRVNLNYDLNGWGLEGVSGYSKLDALRGGDIQPSPSSGWNTVFRENTSDFTLEGLITSPDFADGHLYVTGSVFYQNMDTDNASDVNFAQAHIFDLLGTQRAPPAPVPAGSRDPYTPGNPMGPYPLCCNGIEEIDRFVYQKNDVFAILTQVNWRAADRWTVTGGLRLSWEDKTARLVQINGVPAFLTILTGTLDLDESFKRSESHASPRLAVTFDQTDDVSFYASYTEGYRAGGFSSLLSNPEASEYLEFEDEKIEAWELGTRTHFPDQNLALDVALFYMALTDYQLSTNVPVGVFTPPAVVNVGKATAQGLEADLTWNPTDRFSVNGALGYNNTELVDFPAGPCAPDRPNTDGDADKRCDLSGKPLPRAPKWTLSLTPRVTVPVGDFEAFAGFTVQYTDSQFLAETLDPRSEEGSFIWLDIDVGMRFGDGWTVTLALQNVTDKSVATVVEEIGLAYGTYVQSVRPPRQFFAGVRWEF